MVEIKSIDNDPLRLPHRYLRLYLHGNALWPQKHFVHPILIAEQVVRDREVTFGELAEMHFSERQVGYVASAMNSFHGQQNIQRFYNPKRELPPGHAVPVESILKLWERGVIEGANWIKAFTTLFPHLREATNDLPQFREIYYQDKNRAKVAILTVENLLARNPSETATIASLLLQAKEYFGMEEFQQTAQGYRTALVAANLEDTDLLQFRDQKITKGQYTQYAANSLTAHLKQLNPYLDWNHFQYSYI